MELDEYQKQIIDNDTSIKIIAGAGSGKTFSLLKKIEYLINNKGIKEEEILMISFTNKSTNDIKNKLKYNILVLTFHKLAIKILNDLNYNYKLTNTSYLEYIIDEYFESVVMYSYRKYYVMLLFKNIKYDEIIRSKDFVLFKKNISTFINFQKLYLRHHRLKSFHSDNHHRCSCRDLRSFLRSLYSYFHMTSAQISFSLPVDPGICRSDLP